MPIKLFHMTTSYQARYVYITWHWGDSYQDGYLGGGIYFYTDAAEKMINDESLLRYLSDIEYSFERLAVVSVLIDTEPPMILLDLTDDRIKSLVDPIVRKYEDNFRNTYLKDEDPYRIAILEFLSKIGMQPDVIKHIKAVKHHGMQEPVDILHICVKNESCINRKSITIEEVLK